MVPYMEIRLPTGAQWCWNVILSTDLLANLAGFAKLMAHGPELSPLVSVSNGLKFIRSKSSVGFRSKCKFVWLNRPSDGRTTVI